LRDGTRTELACEIFFGSQSVVGSQKSVLPEPRKSAPRSGQKADLKNEANATVMTPLLTLAFRFCSVKKKCTLTPNTPLLDSTSWIDERYHPKANTTRIFFVEKIYILLLKRRVRKTFHFTSRVVSTKHVGLACNFVGALPCLPIARAYPQRQWDLPFSR